MSQWSDTQIIKYKNVNFLCELNTTFRHTEATDDSIINLIIVVGYTNKNYKEIHKEINEKFVGKPFKEFLDFVNGSEITDTDRLEFLFKYDDIEWCECVNRKSKPNGYEMCVYSSVDFETDPVCFEEATKRECVDAAIEYLKKGGGGLNKKEST